VDKLQKVTDQRVALPPREVVIVIKDTKGKQIREIQLKK
jgi:hypothetical protein